MTVADAAADGPLPARALTRGHSGDRAVAKIVRMARRTAAEARDTRARIVRRALRIASTDGLEGVTIGRLADSLELSKSGVLNHFRTKELLQLAVLEVASEDFRREVWEPASEEKPGLKRLLAIEDRWIALIGGDAWPGGCFWTAAAAELDGRPGPVRDALTEALDRFDKAMLREVRNAVEAGDLPAGTDPDQIVFELRGVVMAANQQLQLNGDARAAQRAHAAVRRILGLAG
jgi:AcrR family transcriptional regulator